MAYPKYIMDQALQELSQRRSRARAQQQQRHQEIARKLPQVIQLEKELTGTSVALSRAILSGVDVEQKIEHLKEVNLYMQENKAQLLRDAGYPTDYLELQYSCPACEDTGFLEHGMCTCLKKLLRELVFQRLTDNANMKHCTFSNFRLDVYPNTPMPGTGIRPREIMTEAYNRCVNYANTFTPASPSLFFQGATGLGKTHLSLAIASAAIDKGYDVIYTTAQNLLNRLEKERFSRDRSEEDSMQFVLDCDLLVLDDLGAEFVTSFSVSAIYNILNTRLIEKRATIISSNLDIQQIEDKYSQRIVSRLVGWCSTIPFVGSDIRTMKLRS